MEVNKNFKIAVYIFFFMFLIWLYFQNISSAIISTCLLIFCILDDKIGKIKTTKFEKYLYKFILYIVIISIIWIIFPDIGESRIKGITKSFNFYNPRFPQLHNKVYKSWINGSSYIVDCTERESYSEYYHRWSYIKPENVSYLFREESSNDYYNYICKPYTRPFYKLGTVYKLFIDFH